jgi:hypothetical protein
MANLGPVSTTPNAYYESHGYGRPWQGERLKWWDESYRLARERIAKTKGEKGAGMRENIQRFQEGGIKHLFDTAEKAGGPCPAFQRLNDDHRFLPRQYYGGDGGGGRHRF